MKEETSAGANADKSNILASLLVLLPFSKFQRLQFIFSLGMIKLPQVLGGFISRYWLIFLERECARASEFYLFIKSD